tara:strand:+ start:535 stop:711 length:177 start_codon:yes stop_codon:yes gene_type:complete
MMDKVWVVFAYDGYDSSKIQKVFTSVQMALEYRDYITKLGDERWNGFYIKEFPIEKGS